MRVAIVGAGIGGLAAAVALSRRGIGVEVYEQAAELREVGVGMHLAPNGSRVLHRWGLAGRLRETAVRPAALEVRDGANGKTLFRQPMGRSWEAEFGAPYYTIHRADLHGILAERLPRGCLHLRNRLVGFREQVDGVRLEFAGGGRAEADVLVGADGVNSAVRRAVAGPDSAVFSGHSAVRGTVPAVSLPRLPARTLFVWTGAASRLLCYPVSGGALWTYVAVLPDAAPRRESWSAVAGPAVLARAFRGWNRDVTALVEAADEAGCWALHDREPLPSWTRGRVTLLGDAAHPMLPHHGQGASQAIEDGAALAHCLAAGPTVPSALLAYEAVRRAHTTRVQLGARDGGSLRLRPSPGAGGGSGAASLVRDIDWIQRHDVERVFTQERSG
ncbi:FAD-dependent monooxygenase [Streptomyces iconiensis]|uniref:FAD-dependent monooxygenase n=1 Tax=Streptomyces iconiensis TaxID=1384038 RepID=A0ABT7A3P5_9ACTN|nr:FAD-dependent monooxygenase [Streptomyces iconiensis]MDJ1135253.1 FAD-dependent monooxygenase [Streptomyces iconiensis]